MKQKNTNFRLAIGNLPYALLRVVLTLPFCIAILLHLFSKLLKSLTYLMLLRIHSAKDELQDFWSITGSVLD